MTDERSHTPAQRCSHCGNTVPMEIVHQYSQLQELGGGSEPPYEEGHIYELLACPVCNGLTFRRYYWNAWGWEDEHDLADAVKFEVLYPAAASITEGLPPDIAKAYEAAQRVRSVDANAYGVLLGRALELVCVDRRASGRYLGNKLADLATKGEIPAKLVDVANGLKDLRNIAAHAALGELSPAEVPILDQLTRAILEYVYSAPSLARKAEETLRQVREGR